MKTITVCWKCKEGGNQNGPLIKITALDYAHKNCHFEHGEPKIANQSFIRVPDDREIREILKKGELTETK